MEDQDFIIKLLNDASLKAHTPVNALYNVVYELDDELLFYFVTVENDHYDLKEFKVTVLLVNVSKGNGFVAGRELGRQEYKYKLMPDRDVVYYQVDEIIKSSIQNFNQSNGIS